jgi:hypothetical protein
LYRGINDFEKGYQPRTRLVKDRIGYLLANSHNILKRWKVYFCQLLNVHGINDEISGSHGMSMKMTVFWDVTPCSLVEVYRHFRGACCMLVREVLLLEHTLSPFVNSQLLLCVMILMMRLIE